MKTMNLFLILMMSSMIIPLKAFAGQEGGSSGGGGDSTEARVDEIRAEILKWINDGSSQNLNLPENISHDDYVKKMIPVLRPQAVTVSFVTSREEEATNDPELKVTVNGKKKTCRGFISAIDQKYNILCNIERFNLTDESEQYSLIHHEYAGLVGIEQNVGAASDYRISSQLTFMLEDKTVKRLAIRSGSQSALTKMDLNGGENLKTLIKSSSCYFVVKEPIVFKEGETVAKIGSWRLHSQGWRELPQRVLKVGRRIKISSAYSTSINFEDKNLLKVSLPDYVRNPFSFSSLDYFLKIAFIENKIDGKLVVECFKKPTEEL